MTRLAISRYRGSRWISSSSSLRRGAVLVVAGALEDAVDVGAQVDDGAPLGQAGAVVGVEDGAAARGQHDVVLVAQVADDFRLAAAKTCFPFDFKNPRNRGARAGLDFMVGVDEAFAQFPGEDAANCCLARTHQSYKIDISRFH